MDLAAKHLDLEAKPSGKLLPKKIRDSEESGFNFIDDSDENDDTDTDAQRS